MNHALNTNARTNGQGVATKMDDYRMAFAEMTTGIKVPKSIGWRIADAKRGRTVKPLGEYPAVADVIIDSGGSYHYVAGPLVKLLAHFRRRCTGKMPADMKSALLNAKKESDEAESVGLTLAFSGQHPDASTLAQFTKEADEAVLALEKAKELAEDRLAEMES